MHIDWLTEIDGPREYGYVTDHSEEGVLVVRTPDGDTLLPPYEGRFTLLEDVSSREDALDAARQWEEQHGPSAPIVGECDDCGRRDELEQSGSRLLCVMCRIAGRADV